MSKRPPKGPGWSNAPGGPEKLPPNSIAHKSEVDRIKILQKDLPALLARARDQPRARAFYPYILVRSLVGDHGDRPINNVPWWESPDIWIAPGDPSVTPAVPTDHGGTFTAGQPHTVYAHVWNLGRAPIAGVKVEFYIAYELAAQDVVLIGMTRVDLGPRSSPHCHRLVKCPQPWVPDSPNRGRLLVRASAIGDNLSSTEDDQWLPDRDRHVAFRYIQLLQEPTDLTEFIADLEARRRPNERWQLLQVGMEAAITLKMVAPGLKVDPAVRTHVLAELRPDGSLHLPSTVAVTPGGSAAATASNVAVQTVSGPFDVPRIVPTALFGVPPPTVTEASPLKGAAPTEILAGGANLTHLAQYFALLRPEIKRRITQLKAPTGDQAHVLRFVSFQGDQVVRGGTVVVKGN